MASGAFSAPVTLADGGSTRPDRVLAVDDPHIGEGLVRYLSGPDRTRP